ncbi:zona pellucida sperm-binding protein 3 receptor-like isoform X2 [Rhincodon typus]|uniref:zona pellucida sperm-binding protein 3 receptor-like isoform X2 n=1 Tax=Rhincodon typus TaxID=259920 RepID=UPI00202FD421|nr:zona pellucida sperm-binding protein 3 receptor-like isoform X2 [Rhincodon typus]
MDRFQHVKVIVQCPDPPHIANGTVSSSDSDSWPYGSIARYSCLGNYSLIGEETITCTVTGQWDKDPPRCQVVRCNRPKVPANGKMVAGFKKTYTYLDTITYGCNKGFKMFGGSVIECRENNTFVPPPPTCERDCGKPPVLKNGSAVNSPTTFPVGTNITYRCDTGYAFQEGGSKRITCRKDGTWSPLHAVCEPINCGNPGEILNGYYNVSDTTFGNKAYFYCDKGLGSIEWLYDLKIPDSLC